MNCIDLHIHTTASDGTDPPRAAVEKAASRGLAAVSITDHDSVSGVPEAMCAGAELGVEVVPGIEVSSDYRDNNVHILGYFIGHWQGNAGFCIFLSVCHVVGDQYFLHGSSSLCGLGWRGCGEKGGDSARNRLAH